MQKRKQPLPISDENCITNQKLNKYQQKKVKLSSNPSQISIQQDDENTNTFTPKKQQPNIFEGFADITINLTADENTQSFSKQTPSLKSMDSHISMFSTQSTENSIVQKLEKQFTLKENNKNEKEETKKSQIQEETKKNNELTPEQIFDCTYKPNVIKFREKETMQIEQFLKDCFDGKQDFRCLLITGMPGSGKTLTVSRILEKMQKQYQQNNDSDEVKKQKKEQCKKLIVHQFNAMNYKNSIDFIKDLYTHLLGRSNFTKKSIKDLLIEVQQFMLRNSQQELVLMIDEFDNLFAKGQAEIFEIFSIVKQTNSSIIGISNSMEIVYDLFKKFQITLPEIKNIVFQPYNQSEMSEIIQQRVNEMHEIIEKSSNDKENKQIINNNFFFDKKAIQLCSGKLYNRKGGDVRCLFDVCKKALQQKKQSLILREMQKRQQQQQSENQVDVKKSEDNNNINDDDNQTQKQQQERQQQQSESHKMNGIIEKDADSQQQKSETIKKEIANKDENTIKISELANIIEELYPRFQTIEIMQNLPSEIKLIIIAIYKILEQQEGLIEVNSKQILDFYNKVCQKIMLCKSDLQQINENLKLLEAYSLLQIRSQDKCSGPGRRSFNQTQLGTSTLKVFLKVTAAEISAGFQNNSGFQSFFVAQPQQQ